MFNRLSTPKFQIPSANLNKIFNQEMPQPSTIKLDPPFKQTIIVPQPQEIKQEILQEKQHDKQEEILRLQFETLVKDKLGRIDEILVALKEKQDAFALQHRSEPTPQSTPAPIFFPTPAPNTAINLTPVQDTAKQVRTKKTYYNITDSMWMDVKTKYPELPDSCRAGTFSDGTNYYVENKNKKLLLDNKTLLKILNKK